MAVFQTEERQANNMALRAQGKIPAILYGGNEDEQKIAVVEKSLLAETQKGGYYNRVHTLEVGDKKIAVLAKHIQYHPVTDRIIHADFMRISKDKKIRIFIPIRYINEDKSVALKRGGVLNIVAHKLEVKTNPHDMPEEFTVDLAGLTMHDTVTLDRLQFPNGVTPVHPKRDFTLATIVAPSGFGEEKAEGAATA